MKRLSARVLPGLTQSAPSYDRNALKPGIVHLGLGAFARAHMAIYTDTLLNSAPADWLIIGVSLRNPDVYAQLTPQDGLYTVVEEGDSAAAPRIVGAISELLVAPEDPQAVLTVMANPDIHIVSLTVTEKGYCHDPASGSLNLQHPDIQWDLAHPDSPKSAIGFLATALSLRAQAGAAPFTPLCCDNLPANGHLLRGLTLQYAEALDSKQGTTLAEHIANNVSFPDTMVDRIVPATTSADREALADAVGYEDAGMVKAEPFRQWVIEDRFSGPRPRWEDAGALLVDDVQPFETMKLRLLNGAHSAIAYLGCTAGFEYVHQVVTQESLSRFIAQLLAEELAPTLTAPPGINLQSYQASLLVRFANSALRHETRQIAMDGSQKLPQRLLAPLYDNIAAGRASPCLIFTLACWMYYVSARATPETAGATDIRDSDGTEIATDPLLHLFQEITEAANGDARRLVTGFLRLTRVFDESLQQNPTLIEALVSALESLQRHGTRLAVERLLNIPG